MELPEVKSGVMKRLESGNRSYLAFFEKYREAGDIRITSIKLAMIGFKKNI
jgi:hypothetical protein